MAHTPLSVETVDGSTQVTVHGLLQMTLLADGTVQIDLDGKRIEVVRNMSINQLIIRHERNDADGTHAMTPVTSVG
ncbi:hypothetical protein GCM10023063_16250 [Arthrobacter methylotrophus]|uniref:Uncharacterized protein n=1 Tax=Arthrobacter methylotrophus TaxID=121291 RepID=A0ABV5UNE9_9MICC